MAVKNYREHPALVVVQQADRAAQSIASGIGATGGYDFFEIGVGVNAVVAVENEMFDFFSAGDDLGVAVAFGSWGFGVFAARGHGENVNRECLVYKVKLLFREIIVFMFYEEEANS